MDGEPARYLDLAVDGLKNKRAAPSTRPSKGTRNVAAPPAVGSARGCDPPREAKEGYEWVWFPEGYWAEREIVPAFENFKAYDNKFWKWRSKSSRGQNLSEGEPRNVSPKTTGQPSPSPKTMVQSPFAAPPAIPPTPFMSERDHIHSLQHPHGQHNESCASEFLGFTVPKTTVPQAKRSSNSSGPDVVAEASPFPLEQAERQPGRHLSQARKDLAGATLKSKEVSRLPRQAGALVDSLSRRKPRAGHLDETTPCIPPQMPPGRAISVCSRPEDRQLRRRGTMSREAWRRRDPKPSGLDRPSNL